MQTCFANRHLIVRGSTTATRVPLPCFPPWLQRRTPCWVMSEGTWVSARWCSTLSMVSGAMQLDPAAYRSCPCVEHIHRRIYWGMHSLCVPLPLQLQLTTSSPHTMHQAPAPTR